MLKNKGLFLPTPKPGGTRRPPVGPRPPRTAAPARKNPRPRRSYRLEWDPGYSAYKFGRDVARYERSFRKRRFQAWASEMFRRGLYQNREVRGFWDEVYKGLYEPWVKTSGGYANPGLDWKRCLDCGGAPSHYTDTLAPIGDECSPENFCGVVRFGLSDTPLPADKTYVGPQRLRYSHFDPTKGWLDDAEFVLPLGKTQVAPEYVPGFTIPLPVELPVGSPEPVVAPVDRLKALQRSIEVATGVSVDTDGKVVGRPSSRVAVQLGRITFVPDWASETVVIASPMESGEGTGDVPPPKVTFHTKEYDGKKKSLPLGAAAALKVYHAFTEVSDALDVLADSIEGKPCKKLPGVRKAACVLNHFSDIDWTVAIPGLIYDQLEDRMVAYLHQFAAEKGFGPNVVQMTQFARQLKMLKADPLSVMKPGSAEKAIKEFMKADDPRFGLGNTINRMISY